MRVPVTVAAMSLLLTSCATTGAASADDPYEGLNRTVWGFNQGVDKVVLKPVSSVYRTVTPKPARRGLSRILANLTEPWSFINNLLQGKPDRAFRNLGRFVVNTTIGVGGLADNATGLGIKPAQEDFGQTLAAWGAKDSPYLVLPLLGPSTVRDGIGSGVAMFGDPYRICLQQCTNLSWTERLGVNAFEVVSARADLSDSGADALLDRSADPYSTAKSAFLARRKLALEDREDDPVSTDTGDGAVPSSDDAALDAAISGGDATAPKLPQPSADDAALDAAVSGGNTPTPLGTTPQATPPAGTPPEGDITLPK